ncbi:methyltransferase domain-containing protein [Catenisphaera adipataccumulans]|jgi:23S rRNA (guanine745-N1)-methyltransferase|uniref:23S rRNA (Guanine745-N1)-methyltransferase n=1 Tax=Catenisphaera adipataccumulans TaxID=700500 RepID=A0A7W8CZ88_9FIRM|nr:methyltransferase domain-containing protein [Catenisphaera adipataccumulans]MBB5183749.1 23S rRNA (guanine745-N1)-methyltransferase [Catenisphaera adipataccumulans]
MFRCPICGGKLLHQNRTFVCANHHTFDQAKEGYVNLSRKQKKDQGDNKQMVRARTAFLEKGYYDFLRQYLMSAVSDLSLNTVLDAGCGQGYYTGAIGSCVKTMAAVDLSKYAVAYASRHDPHTSYAVASIFALPFYDGTFDGVLSTFVPPAPEEIHRVLKPGGYWIMTEPGPRHCLELKQLLYETVIENPSPANQRDGYLLIRQECIRQREHVEDLMNLLDMTPYRYKSPKAGIERVRQQKESDVTFEFMVSIWKKI